MFFILMLTQGIIFYYVFYKRTKDIFNPFGIALFIWCFTSGLASLRLSNLQSDWDLQMYFVILLSTYSIFIVGYSAVPYSKVFYYQNTEIKITKLFKQISRLIFIISFFCAFLEWKVNGYSMAGLMQNYGGDLKSDIAIRGVHYGTVLFPYCALYSFFEFLYDNKKSKKDIIYNIFVICITLFHSYFVLISRGTLLIIILGIIYIYHTKYHLQLRKSIIFLLICVVLFIYISFARLVDSSLVFTSAKGGPAFSSIYTYLVIGFENLNKLIKNGSPFTIVYYTILKPFLSVLDLDNLVSIIDFETVFFNSKTYIYGFYHDLGGIGVIFYTVLLFIIIACIYRRAKEKGKYILLISTLQKPIFVMFFGNYFTGEFVIIFPYIATFFLCQTLYIRKIFDKNVIVNMDSQT